MTFETSRQMFVILSMEEDALPLSTLRYRLAQLKAELAQTHDQTNRCGVTQRIRALAALALHLGFTVAELNR